jgi:hypothetical protein
VRAAGLGNGDVAVPALGAICAREGIWVSREVFVRACGALGTISRCGVVKKAAVAAVDEGGSSVVIRDAKIIEPADIQYGSGLNQEDLGAYGINRAALEVACPPPGIGAKI